MTDTPDLEGLVDEVPPEIVYTWKQVGDRGWEPRCGRNDPRIQKWIADGWLKPCVMRFGFEAMDTGVTWTDAAKSALRAHLQQRKDQDG